MLKENKTVKKVPGDKSRILCQESYAQELYNLITGTTLVRKDLSQGEIVRAIGFKEYNSDEFEIICENYDSLYANYAKEKRYFEMMGMDEDGFKSWMRTGDCKHYLEGHKIFVVVDNSINRRGSLYHAHQKTIIEEFKQQIINPTSAYVAKILSKNQGGFLVEVQGIKAFLPGSLAAANKITSFEEYIGREVHVMIEDYLAPSDIFIVSYKKYLDRILPSKLADLEKNQLMKGTITGTTKFGVFVEFDDIFTGLLHVTEMTSETQEKFNAGHYRSGSTLQVWLKDIKENRLILTDIDPAIKQNEMEAFREKVEGNVRSATIVSIKPHGALMEIEKGVLGLLPIKEMKRTGKRLNVGESLIICIKKVDTSTGKIYLTLTDEQVTAEV